MKSILIVDDEFEVTEILRRLFERNDFKVLTAGNGKEALNILEQSLVDLCIVDLMMPIMDGVELVQALRADSATHAIPIIMMSAGHIDLLDIPYDYFFHKPFLFQDLLTQTKALLASE